MGYINEHMGALCLILSGLLLISESLPFVQKIESNSIAQALIAKAKAFLSGKAKEELNK